MKPDEKPELISALRVAYKNGSQVPELFDLILQHLPDAADRFLLQIIYFKNAFHVPLPDARILGEWNRFRGGVLSDVEINSRVMPMIEKYKFQWDSQEASTQVP